jgi:hypothetical protein
MASQDRPPPPSAHAKRWLEEPLTRWEKAFVGGVKGVLGGAVAGYVGGGLLDGGAAQEQFLLGAGVGACIGIAFGLLGLARGRWVAVKELALWVPVGALLGAAIFGGQHLAVWAFGWAAQRWAGGVLAAAVGAVFGGALGVLFGYATGARSSGAGDRGSLA